MKCKLGSLQVLRDLADSFRESYQATDRKCLALESKDVVREVLEPYSLPAEAITTIAQSLEDSGSLHSFLMKYHFDVMEPPGSRPYISGITLAIAYLLGGFIPLLPYFAVGRDEVLTGLYWSIGTMAFVMLTFGYIKTGVVRGWQGRDNVIAGFKGALQMLVIGGIAAGAAIGLVKAINGDDHACH